MPTNLPPYGSEFTEEGAVLSTLKAHPQPEPNMSVYVSPGGCWMNGRNYMEFSGGNSGFFTAPPAQAKWSILVFNYSGFLQVIDGAQSVNPNMPQIPRNAIPICAVYLQAGTVKITSERIFDIRPVLSNSIFSHKDMEDRLEQNQHSIGSITNLQDVLNTMPTNVDLSAALSTKADLDGTPAEEFILNKDMTGTPSSDVVLKVNRGTSPEVKIRWNEAANWWDWTPDNTTWYRFQPNMFISTEQTGDGLEQSVAHGLDRVPTSVMVCVTDSSGGFSVVEGTHTLTDVKVTVTAGVKYKVMAL